MSSRVLCTSDCQSEKDSLRAEIARRDQELNRLRIQQSFRPITKDLFIRALRAYNNNQVASERRLSDAVAILNEGIAGQALHEVSD